MMRVEKKRKTKKNGNIGGSNEEEAAVKDDSMICLTDDIVSHIISFLDIKEAVGTSILSKRWRFLWTLNPKLDLRFSLVQKPVLAEAKVVNGMVDRYLVHCPNTIRLSVFITLPKLQNLVEHMSLDVHNWISLAIARNVNELCLEIQGLEDSSLRILLSQLLYQHTSLKVLSLSSFTINLPPIDFRGFPFLRILILNRVQITDQTLSTLLLRCPLLEGLVLYYIESLVNLNISSAPKLIFLNVAECSKLKNLLVDDAPNLCSLTFQGPEISPRTNFSLNNVSSLCQAIVGFADPSLHEYKPLVRRLAQVNCLETSTWFSQFIFVEYYVLRTPHINFTNLKEFRWCGCLDRTYSVLALATFLGDCPKLQKLHIRSLSWRWKEILKGPGCISHWYNHYYQLLKDSIPPHLGEPPIPMLDDKHYLQHLDYMLPRLKTIELIEMSGTKMEMDLVRFLLSKANGLDSLILTSRSQKNLKLLKKISSLHKASANAQAVLSKHPLVRLAYLDF